MKTNVLVMVAAGMALALATQANAAVSFTFLENGQEVNLGNTSTFTESGISLTAKGFTTAGATTDLYAKNGGVGETGLGTASDGDHEINTGNFVQLALPTSPPTTLQFILLASVQSGESAKIYFTTSPGTLVGATLIGTISDADGQFDIPAAYMNATGFLDITAGAGNVLVEGLTVVPEPTTLIAGALLLLPFGASTLRTLRNRKA